jgi:hypothetical protein
VQVSWYYFGKRIVLMCRNQCSGYGAQHLYTTTFEQWPNWWEEKKFLVPSKLPKKCLETKYPFVNSGA